MVRFQLILTRLPSVPAHEMAARLQNMPPELNRGILTNAMWRGRLPDVAIGWSEHEAPMRAALARIVELGGEGYVESQPVGIHRLIAMVRAWRTGRRVPPGGKQRMRVPAGLTPVEPAGESQSTEAGLTWLETLERVAEACATFAVLFIVSALLYLESTDPGMIADPLPHLASRRLELLALLVGLLAAQALVYGLRRSFAGGSGVWRARSLVLFLASSALLAAMQIGPSTDKTLAAHASGASRRGHMRSARASHGFRARSTQGSSAPDAALPEKTGALAENPDAAVADGGAARPDASMPGVADETALAPTAAARAGRAPHGASTRTTPSAAATTRGQAPMTELDYLALFAKVISQMSGPAPDPLRRGSGKH